MNKIIHTPPNTTGTLMNLLGKELRIRNASHEYLSFPPAVGANVPRAAWEEWDKTAGLHLEQCVQRERSISLLPDAQEVGLFNGIISLVCPADMQRSHLRHFWQQNFEFRRARGLHLPIIENIHKNSRPQHLPDSTGPATQPHYLPGVPSPVDYAGAYVVMDSGPAMMCYYHKLGGLDHIFIPACYPNQEDSFPNFRLADALIPLTTLLPPA